MQDESDSVEGEAHLVNRWPFSVLAQVTWGQVVTWATVALLLLSSSCTGVLAEMLPYLGAPQSQPESPLAVLLAASALGDSEPHEGPGVRGVCKRSGRPACPLLLPGTFRPPAVWGGGALTTGSDLIL